MVARGLSPIIECVEQAEDWAEAETRWITKLRAAGTHLVNGNEGGHTMHQARERAGAHPALKRAYRNLESNARYFSRTGDSIRHYKMVLIKELLLRTAKACRRAGTHHLDRLEAALSASALGSH